MEAIKLRDLKKGEFFTRKPIEEPKESQVFIKGEYDRSEKKYDCDRFSDISSSIQLKADTVVYIGFTF